MSGGQSYNSPVDFRISQVPPIGITDPTAADAIAQLYAGMQQVIRTFIQYCGIGPESTSLWSELAGSSSTLLAGNLNRLYITASEAIANGAMINLWSNSGVLEARNANATDNTKICDGFTVNGAIAVNAVGEVQLNSGITEINGLTPGARYWLSTSNGLVASSPAVASGNVEQYLGVAIDSTHLSVNLGAWIQH